METETSKDPLKYLTKDLPKNEPAKSANDTDLSRFRTNLSEHRTGLSEKRTGMSEERTDLSEKRTQLSNLRSHLSNERTHLSYLRTGVALISFGVTLNRFSLFLIQSNEMTRYGGRHFLRDAKNVGIGMVVLGSIMLIWAIFHFTSTYSQINDNTYKPTKWPIILFTSLVILVGVSSTVWMITG